METKVFGNEMRSVAVKTMASVARSIAQGSVDGRCWWFVYQPKEPKDLAKRLQAIQKNND